MSFVSSLLSSPLQTAASALPSAKAAATTGTASSSTTSSADAIGSTFLSLLVQELQNQDPTAPMDSTAMVGQMISLNQLNQLTNINQVLSNAYSSTATSSGNTSTNSATTKLQSAAADALHLLQSTSNSIHSAVAPSVSLPAL